MDVDLTTGIAAAPCVGVTAIAVPGGVGKALACSAPSAVCATTILSCRSPSIINDRDTSDDGCGEKDYSSGCCIWICIIRWRMGSGYQSCWGRRRGRCIGDGGIALDVLAMLCMLLQCHRPLVDTFSLMSSAWALPRPVG